MKPGDDLCSAVLDQLQSGVLVLDAERRVRYLNPWLRSALGERSGEAEPGRSIDGLLDARAAARLQAAIDAALQGLPGLLSTGLNPHPLPLRQRRADGSEGEPMAQSVQVQALRFGDEPCVLVTVADVSAMMRREGLLREQAEKLSSLSLTDELTGIANRRRLNHYLEDSLRRAQRAEAPLSVILLDIDHFKAYNDSLGHIAGDACLVSVVDCLKSLVRSAGDLLARYGGEEFCVVLAEEGGHSALDVAERLRQAVESLRLSHPASPTAAHITISLGVATWTPERRLSATGLLLKADRYLFEAKQGGRNRVAPGR
jgi:diguanylate cyclase (GGDEF)-like protein